MLHKTAPNRAALRAFFALWPDAVVRAALAPLVRDIARKVHGRPTAVESIHLTLAFLGEVAQAALPSLEAIGAAMPRGTFVIELAQCGTFGGARVAWAAPAETPPELVMLESRLRAAIAAGGFRTEERAFAPHLTLVRRCGRALPRTAITRIAWKVDRLSLVASSLEPGGARYREVAGWPL
jgi:2'-5' RNA ligase